MLKNLLPLLPSATSRPAIAGTKCFSGGTRKPSPWPVSLNGSSKPEAGCKLTRMRYFTNRSLVCWCFPFLVVSSGCIAAPECDSIETRMAVLQFVSGDGNNPLVTYAAKNSTVGKASATAKSQNSKSETPLYQLGQKIVTTSKSKDKLTVKCSGGISAAVGDIKATKEVTFTVQQSSYGTISVSVDPFQF
jgi:hypothetical protein